MIVEGDVAPGFTLPTVVDGEVEEVALGGYLGGDIIVLVFYPADFDPCCSGEWTGLDEGALFTMQKDVSAPGISADSVYSHCAFAKEYDLHVPLLAGVHGEVATDHGVAVEDATAGSLTNSAVVVVDPDGEVQYTWQTDDLTRLPPVEQIGEAVDDAAGSSAAAARYRVGHARYVEGRRAFRKAIGSFGERGWVIAQGAFTRATEGFEAATDRFDTATRFAEDEDAVTEFERAEEKARLLWQAAEWLTGSASAYASGNGGDGQSMRADAERPRQAAHGIDDPPSPGDPPVTPGRDIDDVESPAPEPPADSMNENEPVAESEDRTVRAGGSTCNGEGIDAEELEASAAELEAQARQAQPSRDRRDTADGGSNDPAAGAGNGGPEGDGIKLDLTDPTEGTGTEPGRPAESDEDDRDSNEDETGSGGHGAPDSL